MSGKVKKAAVKKTFHERQMWLVDMVIDLGMLLGPPGTRPMSTKETVHAFIALSKGEPGAFDYIVPKGYNK